MDRNTLVKVALMEKPKVIEPTITKVSKLSTFKTVTPHSKLENGDHVRMMGVVRCHYFNCILLYLFFKRLNSMMSMMKKTFI